MPPGQRRKHTWEIVPVSLANLKDRNLSDEREFHVPLFLTSCGEELSYEEGFRYFQDPQAMIRKRMQALFAGAPDDPETVEGVLEAGGAKDSEAETRVGEEQIRNSLDFGVDVAAVNPRMGASIECAACAVAAENGVEPDGIKAALRRAAEADPGRTAWMLGELGGRPCSGSLGDFEIERRGVPPKPFPAGEFSHGLVSTVDGAGSRELVLLFRKVSCSRLFPVESNPRSKIVPLIQLRVPY